MMILPILLFELAEEGRSPHKFSKWNGAKTCDGLINREVGSQFVGFVLG
jgi:hypothetical protein